MGRGGKLTNDHPYLSAVALLRRGELRTDRIKQIAAEVCTGHRPSDFGQAALKAEQLLSRLRQEELPTGDYVYVDVIETISASAVPLPEDWFDGERDSRWRLNADGCFELLRREKSR